MTCSFDMNKNFHNPMNFYGLILSLVRDEPLAIMFMQPMKTVSRINLACLKSLKQHWYFRVFFLQNRLCVILNSYVIFNGSDKIFCGLLKLDLYFKNIAFLPQRRET